MRRNIAVDIAVWCYKHIVADSDAAYDSAIYTHPHIIADNWRPFALSAVFLTDSHALVYIAVFPDLGMPVDRYAYRVADVQSRPDFCLI